jgi:translation initiation factor 2B subunit (eIF-2B alpha/beta/delta family)
VPVPEQLAQRIAALAANTTSGASELLPEAIDILAAARATGADVHAVAHAVSDAQPSMASFRNAAAAALSPDPDRLDTFVQRVRRAPAALARFAAAHFAEDNSGRPLHVVTLSYSSSVLIVLNAIGATRPLRVSCSESRPALEGRRLAADLAAMRVAVMCYSDAAIAEALDDADAVIVGADAVAPSEFLNKVGTTMLASAAAQQGVASYVVATRDKFVGREPGQRLVIRHGEPRELWLDPPTGVTVRNPYFEWTPLDLITAVISDTGVLGIGMMPDVCGQSSSAAGT